MLVREKKNWKRIDKGIKPTGCTHNSITANLKNNLFKVVVIDLCTKNWGNKREGENNELLEVEAKN